MFFSYLRIIPPAIPQQIGIITLINSTLAAGITNNPSAGIKSASDFHPHLKAV